MPVIKICALSLIVGHTELLITTEPGKESRSTIPCTHTHQTTLVYLKWRTFDINEILSLHEYTSTRSNTLTSLYIQLKSKTNTVPPHNSNYNQMTIFTSFDSIAVWQQHFHLQSMF